MTIFENSIHIDAPTANVWSALAALDALAAYDPGVVKSDIISAQKEGVGAERRCDLKPGGWFKERVSEWKPAEALAFELFECTLPVKALKHRYTLRAEGGTTVVSQHMEYQLKFGPLGTLLDALVVRRKWAAGVKSFLVGLKHFVEHEQSPLSSRSSTART